MRFTQAGLAATLALAASAVVIQTDYDVVYATEIVYVDGAGHTLSEAAYTPAAASTTKSKHHHGHPSSASAASVSPANVPSSYSAPAYSPPAYTPPAYTPPAYTTPATTLQTYASSAPPPPQSYAPQPTGSCPNAAAVYAAADCSAASDAAYCRGGLGATNVHRANHSAPALVWNATLESWAKMHTDQCIFQDYLLDEGTYHQSNAFAGSNCPGDAEAATADWYNSEEPLFASAGLYGNANPPADVQGHEIGHFANVIWNGWTSMGCATTLCNDVQSTTGSSMMTNANLTLCFYSVYDLSAQSYAVNVNQPAGCPSYQ